MADDVNSFLVQDGQEAYVQFQVTRRSPVATTNEVYDDNQMSDKPFMSNQVVASESGCEERGGVSAAKMVVLGITKGLRAYGLVKGAGVEITAPIGERRRIERRVIGRPRPERGQ